MQMHVHECLAAQRSHITPRARLSGRDARENRCHGELGSTCGGQQLPRAAVNVTRLGEELRPEPDPVRDGATTAVVLAVQRESTNILRDVNLH